MFNVEHYQVKTLKKLTIIVPVYNEVNTIEKIINKVFSSSILNYGIKLEVIVVDDGSTDGTSYKLSKLSKKYNLITIYHQKNKGKTAAIKTGIKHLTGDVAVIQDGDLEYNPDDFVQMLDKMKEDSVRVVYGSRRLMKTNVQYSGLSFFVGGLFLTHLTNILYGTHITDEPTCYKMFDSTLLKTVKISSNKFEFCPEVTAKISKMGERIYEVPISYHPRHIAEGKKIKMKDFFEALWVLVKYKFVN